MKIITGTTGSGKTRELCRLVALESSEASSVTVIFDGERRDYYMRQLVREGAELSKITLVSLQAHTVTQILQSIEGNLVFLDVEMMSPTDIEKLEQLEADKKLNITVTVQTNRLAMLRPTE